MERIRSEGQVAFLEYYTSAKDSWTLRVVKEPDLGAVKRIRRWWSKH